MKSTDSQARKRIVRSFFNLVLQGRQKESLRYFAPNCKQHNPYVKGGMAAPFDSMAEAQKEAPKHPDLLFTVMRVLADGDFVAAHTELLSSRSKPGEGGLRQVLLFRFGGSNKIVEYWDITQAVLPDMPNPANAF